MKMDIKGKSSNPRFTVIVPTRERCDTLRWCLKTCVEQDYEGLEILVSDNFSQDATRDVVAAYSDPRIKYINTGERLSMSHNWEFALAHATGDYVTFIGDDDGLMPNGVSFAAKVINETGAEALICKKPLYYWPTVKADEYKNVMLVNIDDTLVEKDSREVLADVKTFTSVANIPMLYDGFVRKDVLDRVKEMSGRFFNSQVPDFYSGIALLGVLPTYHHTMRPFLIQGISGHSIGASYLVQGATTDTAANRFYGEENIPFHSKLIAAPVMEILFAESLLQAKEHVRTSLDFSFDEKVLVEKSMISAIPLTPQKYADVVAGVRYIGETYGIRDFVEGIIAKTTNLPEEDLKPFHMGYNFMKKALAVKIDERKATNIYEASLECEELRKGLSPFGYIKNSIPYVEETLRRRGLISKVGKAFGKFVNGRTS